MSIRCKEPCVCLFLMLIFGSLQPICLSKGFHMGLFVPACSSAWMTLWHHYSYFINEAQRDFVISHKAFSKQVKELWLETLCVCVSPSWGWVLCSVLRSFCTICIFPQKLWAMINELVLIPFRAEKEVEKHPYCCQSCPTVCNPLNCSPPGSSVHGIVQTRTLEGVAISFSRESCGSPVIKLEVCFVTIESIRRIWWS